MPMLNGCRIHDLMVPAISLGLADQTQSTWRLGGTRRSVWALHTSLSTKKPNIRIVIMLSFFVEFCLI